MCHVYAYRFVEYYFLHNAANYSDFKQINQLYG